MVAVPRTYPGVVRFGSPEPPRSRHRDDPPRADLRAIAAAVHRRARHVDGHTRGRGNFGETLIPYAVPVIALSLALDEKLVAYLTREEMQAVLDAPGSALPRRGTRSRHDAYRRV